MKPHYTLKKKSLQYLFVLLMLSFMSTTTFTQTLNFTIDTAIDNGTSITETIISGDTYVLTIFHTGNEELDDLGGGDLIFYLSATDPLSPFIVSMTKNGAPFSFTLNSLDYDTLEAGNISVTNHNDVVIATSITYPLGAGSIVISNPANAVDISNFKIIPTDNDDLNDFGFHNINITVGTALNDVDLELNNQVLIYPNPSSGKIAIKNSSRFVLQSIEISDLKGRVVKSNVTDQMNLSELSSGVYLVNINSDRGTIVKKLIIK